MVDLSLGLMPHLTLYPHAPLGLRVWGAVKKPHSKLLVLDPSKGRQLDLHGMRLIEIPMIRYPCNERSTSRRSCCPRAWWTSSRSF